MAKGIDYSKVTPLIRGGVFTEQTTPSYFEHEELPTGFPRDNLLQRSQSGELTTDIEAYKARQEGFLYSGAKDVANIGLKALNHATIGMAGGLWATAEAGGEWLDKKLGTNIVDKPDYTNPLVQLAETVDKGLDENIPLYSERPKDPYAWGDKEWWAKDVFTPVVTTAAEMALPMAGLGWLRPLTRGANLINTRSVGAFKNALATGKAGKPGLTVSEALEALPKARLQASTVANIGTAGDMLFNSGVTTALASTMVASQVYKKAVEDGEREFSDKNLVEMYDKYIQEQVLKGEDSISFEQFRDSAKQKVKEVASQVASDVFDANMLNTFALNLGTAKLFSRGFQGLRGNTIKHPSILKEGLKEALNEGTEEVINLYNEAGGNYSAMEIFKDLQGKVMDKSKGEYIDDRIFSEEGIQAAVIGALGGGVMAGIGGLYTKLTQDKGIKERATAAEEAQGKVREAVQNQMDMELLNSIASIADKTDNPVLYASAEDLSFAKAVVSQASQGTLDTLDDVISDYEKMDQKTAVKLGLATNETDTKWKEKWSKKIELAKEKLDLAERLFVEGKNLGIRHPELLEKFILQGLTQKTQGYELINKKPDVEAKKTKAKNELVSRIENGIYDNEFNQAAKELDTNESKRLAADLQSKKPTATSINRTTTSEFTDTDDMINTMEMNGANIFNRLDYKVDHTSNDFGVTPEAKAEYLLNPNSILTPSLGKIKLDEKNSITEYEEAVDSIQKIVDSYKTNTEELNKWGDPNYIQEENQKLDDKIAEDNKVAAQKLADDKAKKEQEARVAAATAPAVDPNDPNAAANNTTGQPAPPVVQQGQANPNPAAPQTSTTIPTPTDEDIHEKDTKLLSRALRPIRKIAGTVRTFFTAVLTPKSVHEIFFGNIPEKQLQVALPYDKKEVSNYEVLSFDLGPTVSVFQNLPNGDVKTYNIHPQYFSANGVQPIKADTIVKILSGKINSKTPMRLRLAESDEPITLLNAVIEVYAVEVDENGQEVEEYIGMMLKESMEGDTDTTSLKQRILYDIGYKEVARLEVTDTIPFNENLKDSYAHCNLHIDKGTYITNPLMYNVTTANQYQEGQSENWMARIVEMPMTSSIGRDGKLTWKWNDNVTPEQLKTSGYVARVEKLTVGQTANIPLRHALVEIKEPLTGDKRLMPTDGSAVKWGGATKSGTEYTAVNSVFVMNKDGGRFNPDNPSEISDAPPLSASVRYGEDKTNNEKQNTTIGDPMWNGQTMMSGTDFQGNEVALPTQTPIYSAANVEYTRDYTKKKKNAKDEYLKPGENIDPKTGVKSLEKLEKKIGERYRGRDIEITGKFKSNPKPTPEMESMLLIDSNIRTSMMMLYFEYIQKELPDVWKKIESDSRVQEFMKNYTSMWGGIQQPAPLGEYQSFVNLGMFLSIGKLNNGKTIEFINRSKDKLNGKDSLRSVELPMKFNSRGGVDGILDQLHKNIQEMIYIHNNQTNQPTVDGTTMYISKYFKIASIPEVFVPDVYNLFNVEHKGAVPLTHVYFGDPNLPAGKTAYGDIVKTKVQYAVHNGTIFDTSNVNMEINKDTVRESGVPIPQRRVDEPNSSKDDEFTENPREPEPEKDFCQGGGSSQDNPGSAGGTPGGSTQGSSNTGAETSQNIGELPNED